MSSFFSERTAEYALVPLIQHALQSHFGSAIPIYYWKTREGNQISLDIHKVENVRILAMFARRPKITNSQHIIDGKINAELFQFAKIAHSLGIPTIAGFPAVTSLMQLYSNPKIFWLSLDFYHENKDVHFFVDTTKVDFYHMFDHETDSISVVSLQHACEMVEQFSEVMSWQDAINRIAQLRNTPYGYRTHFFSRLSGYKPVYFLIRYP